MAIGKNLLAACMLVACLGSTGCIYNHTVMPLDVNFNETPVYQGRQGDWDSTWKTLRIPLLFVPGYVQFDWGSSGIADAARAQGMTEIYYADLETLSVLGVWRQQWAIVYGKQ
jgi:hypothetical protein